MDRYFGIRDILYTAATGIGKNLLARTSAVSKAPEGATEGAKLAAAGFTTLAGIAQAAQDDLVVHVATVEMAADAHGDKVELAKDLERDLDAEFAALCAIANVEVRLKKPGAPELVARLFPDGSRAVTTLSGRPQAGEYLAWYVIAADPTTAGSPAYGAIAGLLPTFKAHLDAFAATLEAKDDLAVALDVARKARDASQQAWTEAFRDLIDAAARIQGKSSKAFEGWIKPILDWKANQKGATTRRAKAAAK